MQVQEAIARDDLQAELRVKLFEKVGRRLVLTGEGEQVLADCRSLLDGDSKFLVLTVYAVRMSALAIAELLRQATADLGGTVEAGEMAVREEARGLLLPTAIFARWRRD